jgi:hypothetical protein
MSEATMKTSASNSAEAVPATSTKKRSRGASPSARSTAYLRRQGFIVTKVEQKIHMPKSPFPVTRDAFGFGDLLIAKPGFGAALVQVTDASSITHRINKINGIAHDPDSEKQIKEAIFANIHARKWLESGNRIFVHGWSKKGPRGARKVWTVIEREICLKGLRKSESKGSESE